MGETWAAPIRKKLLLMQLLTTCGLIVTGFLIWSAYQTGPIAGCGSQGIFSCDHVLTSRWSKVFGMPVSIPAAGVYAVLFGALFVTGLQALSDKTRRAAWTTTGIVASAAALSAIWFISLQVFVLQHICKYCLVVHSISLVIAGMFFFGSAKLNLQKSKPLVAGLAAAALLIAAQVFGPVSKTYELESYQAQSETDYESFDAFEIDFEEMEMEEDQSLLIAEGEAVEVDPAPVADISAAPPVQSTSPSPPEPSTSPAPQLPPPTPSLTPVPDQDEQATTSHSESAPKKRYILFPGAKAKLNVNQWPMLGSPCAEHIFVELFDYTCGHCRQMNQHLEVVRSRYGDQVAIMVLPVPLNGDCNQTIH